MVFCYLFILGMVPMVVPERNINRVDLHGKYTTKK